MKERKVTVMVKHMNHEQWERFLWQINGGHGAGFPIEGSANNIRSRDGRMETGFAEVTGTGIGACGILDEFCIPLDESCEEVTFEIDSLKMESFNQILDVACSLDDPSLANISCTRMICERGSIIADGVQVILEGTAIRERMKFVIHMF